MIQTTIYRTTGGFYYCRFILQKDNTIWDGDSEALSSNPTWAHSAVAMTEVSGTGQFPIVVPEDLPDGVYDTVVYIQAGETPANTDTIDSGYVLKKGGAFGF